jgi:hypothetical protein
MVSKPKNGFKDIGKLIYPVVTPSQHETTSNTAYGIVDVGVTVLVGVIVGV